MPAPRTPAALDWEDVRFFAALARHRSVAAAARALGSTCAEVERRLGNLESALGHRLFHHPRHELSAAGAAALAEAAQMEMAACSLAQLRARRELSTGDLTDCTGRSDSARR